MSYVLHVMLCMLFMYRTTQCKSFISCSLPLCYNQKSISSTAVCGRPCFYYFVHSIYISEDRLNNRNKKCA